MASCAAFYCSRRVLTGNIRWLKAGQQVASQPSHVHSLMYFRKDGDALIFHTRNFLGGLSASPQGVRIYTSRFTVHLTGTRATKLEVCANVNPELLTFPCTRHVRVISGEYPPSSKLQDYQMPTTLLESLSNQKMQHHQQHQGQQDSIMLTFKPLG